MELVRCHAAFLFFSAGEAGLARTRGLESTTPVVPVQLGVASLQPQVEAKAQRNSTPYPSAGQSAWALAFIYFCYPKGP